MWQKKVIEIGEPRQAGLMSPHMFLTISHKTTSFIGHESIYLSTHLNTTLYARFRVYHCNTFRKVLDVLSEWMVRREELTMPVERRILATLLQPNEPHIFLAYWAWELPVDTPGDE
jgi:hypothetical protein